MLRVHRYTVTYHDQYIDKEDKLINKLTITRVKVLSILSLF